MEQLSSKYDPSLVEARWYAAWRDLGYFRPDDNADLPPYAVVLPPPNVTGRLHMGHALTATIQDCLVRWKRMSAHAALWLPGTDHAGISTQVMVERQLRDQPGRHDHDHRLTNRAGEGQQESAHDAGEGRRHDDEPNRFGTCCAEPKRAVSERGRHRGDRVIR